ncbi:MAG: SPOR domain-containing protein [bacterium]
MEKISSSITQILQKWSLLRVSIIILGNLVIFGLGFALGLNYAQNLYLVKKRVSPLNNTKSKEINANIKTNDEFSFFYGLKNPSVETKSKNDKIEANEKREINKNQEDIHDTDISTQKNILPSELPIYTIQLYSFRSKDVSERKVKELKKKGFSAYQTKIDLGNNDIYYRVRVGQFKTREDATEVLVKIFDSETRDAYITRN